MRTTKLASVLGDHLELPSGQIVELGTPEFIHWLETPENRSFRFQNGFAGEHSFTARKESSKKGQGDYWYGYRKVDGKLHKRYIGKTEDLTRPRLEEVAVALDTPAPERVKSSSYISSYVTEEIAPAQPSGYISSYVTEEIAPAQPSGYISSYVTKEEFAAYQQHCKELEVQLEKSQQERDHFKALYQYSKQDYEGLANQGILLHQCNRENQELKEQVYQLKGELERLQNEPKQQPDYEALGDRALFELKLGKQAPGYKAAAKAVKRFIALLKQS